MYDISIIGAGVVGGAIARELSKYDLNICILEKSDDVSNGASKSNSGIVHGGYVAKHGTLKGELCIKGNKMYPQLNKELNFGYRKTGAVVIGFNNEDEKQIRALYENGLKVGCDDLEIIYEDKIKEIEPHINKDVKVALYAKDVGVTSPYELVVALIENAIDNGVELRLNTEVLAIEKKEKYFNIKTNNGYVRSKYVINAAGLYSDKIANMVGIDDFQIIPRKGQYVLFGKDQGYLVKTVVFQVPTEKGKGILVTTTYHGNFMIGPNAEDVDDRNDITTTIEGLEYVVEYARKSIPDFNIKKALTTFSGVRAISSTKDFIIKESKVKGFINVAGIDSPGLTAAPAIAVRTVEILKNAGVEIVEKNDFNPYRKPIFIKKDKDFDGKIGHEDRDKNIICRCEQVTEAEIIDALHRNIPIDSIEAVKKRTRTGMGLCQATFCTPRIKEIMAREFDSSEDDMDKFERERPVRVPIKEIKNIDK
ncbi:MAG: NAD(P)/FAD-dependent oxidoreductase [Clostridiales bacterium]|nr:NAD(P)/FAD-dependent oxidoreductase [Clostridiales bacterium]